MFRISLPLKLMLSYLLVGALMLLPVFYLLRPALTETLVRAERQQLVDQATALKRALSPLSGDRLDASVSHYGELLRVRITVISETGTVLADSQLDPKAIAGAENHAGRPEVHAALSGDVGFAMRRSESLGEDLIYVAVRMDARDERTPADVRVPLRVLRLASKRALLTHTADQAIVALRIGGGVGISAAMLLSLVAALYVASPLRRMTHVAQAFAQANWVAVKRLHSGDELEDLSMALDELGKQLRRQLVALGAAEATLVQTLDALSTPALILCGDSSVLHKNGAFRRALAIRPESEDVVMAELLGAFSTALSAQPQSRALHFFTPSCPHPLSAFCIARPGETPWWLVIGDEHAGAERQTGAGDDSREHRRIEADVVAADELITRCVDQVEQQGHAPGTPAHPSGRIAVAPIPDVMLAEPSGRSGRALRRLLHATLDSSTQDGPLRLTCSVEPAHLLLRLSGGAPNDMSDVVRLARALGTDAGTDEGSDSGGAWLRLPRA